MKQFLTTILAIVYLTASSGATITLHYCMGKLNGWDLLNKNEGKLGTCHMKKAGHKDCCHNEQKQFKTEKNQKAAESVFQFQRVVSATIAVSHADLFLAFPSLIVTDYPTANAPPRLGAVQIFLLNCNFRI